MSITIIGIGEDWLKQQYKLKMNEMIGDHGKVLMYETFDELANGFAELLAAACRKLVVVFV